MRAGVLIRRVALLLFASSTAAFTVSPSSTRSSRPQLHRFVLRGVEEGSEGDASSDTSTPPTPSPPPPPGFGDVLATRLQKCSPLEIRLDISILWCFILGRGLFQEILTRPLKTRPGIELADLQILLGLVSSASLLSVLWVAVGALGTGQFQAWEDQDVFWSSERRRDARALRSSRRRGEGGGGETGEGGSEEGGQNAALLQYLRPTIATWALAGPLWLAGDEAARLTASLQLALSSVSLFSVSSMTSKVATAVVMDDGGLDDAVAAALLSQPLAPSALEHAATDLSALLGLLATVCGARILALFLPS